MKKVCFFGIYDRDYPRNKVLIMGLEQNGYEISHCNVNPKKHKGFKKYWLLAKERFALKGKRSEFVVVAFPGHTCVWLARILFPGTTIVFDVFLSLHEANVSDRKVHKARSLKGYRDYFLDWYGIRLADVVTMDTDTHLKVFQRKYGLNPDKGIRIFLSSALPAIDADQLNNNNGKRADKFVVHFHGSFIPLHGVEFVVRAAKILEKEADIEFKLIGGGQQLEKMKELAPSLSLTNVEFLGRLPEYSEVLKRLEAADIMLGVFGTSERTGWVITNKIFEGMAFGKAILSADNPAMREIFTDRENIVFCRAGDPDDLAAKILELKQDPVLRQKIGTKALEVFREKLSPEKLIHDFLVELHEKI